MRKKGRKFNPAITIILLFAVVVITVFLLSDSTVSFYHKFLAGLMPIETTTPEKLKTAYNSRDLKVLLVPGHDNIDYGTEFNGIREADLTKLVAGELYDILNKDEHLQVYATRNFITGDYTPIFASYFAEKDSSIINFRTRLKEIMANAFKIGLFQTRTGVGHNDASSRIAQKLYGINKWANENNIDIILHIHFNDHADRRAGRIGVYDGFSIYIPEKQFSSSRASRTLAESIFDQLKKISAISSLEGESQGITEDQELIAVGANGSIDGVSVLIEYGYIYEPQFTAADLRQSMMAEIAYQTYAGIKKYFEPQIQLADTTLLPHIWKNPMKKGLTGKEDVLALQSALLHNESLYPPPGKSITDCPLNGKFGPCTEMSVVLFQEKYADEVLRPIGLPSGTGLVGPATIKKLNELYGNEFSHSGD